MATPDAGSLAHRGLPQLVRECQDFGGVATDSLFNGVFFSLSTSRSAEATLQCDFHNLLACSVMSLIALPPPPHGLEVRLLLSGVYFLLLLPASLVAGAEQRPLEGGLKTVMQGFQLV